METIFLLEFTVIPVTPTYLLVLNQLLVLLFLVISWNTLSGELLLEMIVDSSAKRTKCQLH